jgi:N-acetylgalactosamine kinase
VFNHRVACYHVGREMLKAAYPEHAPAIQHLRDINMRSLGIGYADLLRMLKRLPTTARRQDVVRDLGPDLAERYLSSHSASLDEYALRSVVMFGLAECERSRSCVDLLRRGAAAEFGQAMSISHDGDRVVAWDRHGNSWPFQPDYSDAAMDALAARAEAGDASADLAWQPGSYSCSIPQIDRLVDIALSVEGVLGAQIAGAGLGGCAMVLVHSAACPNLQSALASRFYEPSGLEPDMFACCPVSGSGVIAC